ncbi:MAG TPA: RNA methyltransferase [Planctomycetota bacterium]|nr:RNA methyltransferase [Planctomycetota bacterium]
MVEHRATMEKAFGEPRETIRSAQHPLLKRVGAILAGAERDACLLEGDRLIDDALRSNVDFEVILVSTEREDRASELERLGLRVQRVDGALLAKKSALRASPGIAAITKTPRPRAITELGADKDALVLVVAGISDPGNLGALARSAEAAGVRGLIVIAGGASPWGDKALRGSMGSLLRLPVSQSAAASEAAEELRAAGFRLVAAATRGGKSLAGFDWSGRVALWIGSETGLNPREMGSFERVTIPMAGAVESLNVTVAASLLLFAAGRAEGTRP